MYKDRRGIFYKNFIHRLMGIASPSLNWRYGGWEQFGKGRLKETLNVQN